MPQHNPFGSRAPNGREGSDGHEHSESQAVSRRSPDIMRGSTFARVSGWINRPFRSRLAESAVDRSPLNIDQSSNAPRDHGEGTRDREIEAARDHEEITLVSEMESRLKALQERHEKERKEFHNRHKVSMMTKGYSEEQLNDSDEYAYYVMKNYQEKTLEMNKRHEKQIRDFHLDEDTKLRDALTPPMYGNKGDYQSPPSFTPTPDDTQS